jgi:hypothetical protein
MDDIGRRLMSMNWVYGDGDPSALAELHRRIADTGRRETLIEYQKLLNGVTFRLANVAGGEPFHIDLSEGRELDRAILGSFLGRMCADTYPTRGFMASALAISGTQRKPGAGFGRLMTEIGAVRNNAKAIYDFWVAEVTKAHAWYVAHPESH